MKAYLVTVEIDGASAFTNRYVTVADSEERAVHSVLDTLEGDFGIPAEPGEWMSDSLKTWILSHPHRQDTGDDPHCVQTAFADEITETQLVHNGDPDW